MEDFYAVTFGRVAWTLEYQDRLGMCIVTFDPDLQSLEQHDQPQRIVLNPGVSSVDERGHEQMSTDTERVRTVMLRVRQYLESIGYRVDEYTG